MSHEIRLAIDNQDALTCRSITCMFDDEEWDALLQYVKYTKDLTDIELLQKGGPCELKINCNITEGFTYSVNLPPEEQVLVLLHRLRPFLLNDEFTNFNRISNYLSRRLEDKEFRKYMKALREIYAGQRMQNKMLIKANDEIINSDKTLQKWLNAHEYHKNRDKQKELELLNHILPLEASRAIFIMLLNEKVWAIKKLANMINVLIGKQKSYSFELQ